ncbi:MAG: hypothetical protein HZB68_05425 [Candidatus Aenigmarchaeota archaeon]|nr:hypothetical protein [Candidatus Aenigmarchaeota archaeon]
MKGICQGCGKDSDLIACKICYAKNCPSCNREFGCPLCRGGAKFGEGFR